jgi:transcriptional regulator with XRE-family HTH domain
MPHILPSYLHTLRLQWGLTQAELAALLGVSASLVSKVETLARRPTTRVMVPAEILFGRPGDEIFPGAYREMERGVARRGQKLCQALRARNGWAAAEKTRLLRAMVKRVARAKKDA